MVRLWSDWTGARMNGVTLPGFGAPTNFGPTDLFLPFLR